MIYSYIPGSETGHYSRPPGGVVLAAPPVPPAPLVTARPPYGPDEIAGGTGQALFIGRKARAAGFDVEPVYYRGGDGTHYCALRLRRGRGRAVATWKREAAGKSWATDAVYAWADGEPDSLRKINVTTLSEMIG